MRRLLVIAAALVAAAVTAVLLGAGGAGDHYRVRAIFDSAVFSVKGEDVKVAGVKVGKIESLHVTPERKAAIVLDITDPGFQDFRTDATCMVRPQSLIGEQFVECTPTQARASTTLPSPPLPVIRHGAGRGERLLDVQHTSASVALDLVGDTMRLPVRQRLTLIVNELGVGLAGRGEDLNAVIRRSAPALQELDKVLALLASQNKTLSRLAVDSDAILAPLARKRRNVTGFIAQSQKVAAATAERRAALQAGLRRFPAFLAQARPTMRRLSGLADQMTPVAADLRAQAPAINELIRRTGPFSKAATPAIESLGDVAEPGIPALRASLPITRELRTFASRLRPVGRQLAAVLDSVRRNDGLERVLDFAYFGAQSFNGFDSLGHFLRAGLLVNTCSTYAVAPSPECASKFSGKSASASSASLAATATATATPAPKATRTPRATPAAQTAPAPAPASTPAPSTQLLDFLFSKDAP